MPSPHVLVVFARAPQLGRVKTRLASVVGDEAALSIYRGLAEQVMQQVCGDAEFVVTVACAPDSSVDDVREWLGAHAGGRHVEGQGTGDLGARMHGAMLRHFGRGARKVVIIGTDCPAVNAQVVRSAMEALDHADVVFGPALDGGYYLVGAAMPVPQLFTDVPWSAANTLEVSLDRAARSGLRVQLLSLLADIDTAEDWEAWRRSGKEGGGTLGGGRHSAGGD